MTGRDPLAAPAEVSLGVAGDEGPELRHRLERLMRRREVLLRARLRGPHRLGDIGDLAIPGEMVESVDHRVEEGELADIDREITEIERRLAALELPDPFSVRFPSRPPAS